MVLLQFAFFVRLHAPILFQDGDTALMLACGGGHAEVVKALLGAKPKANVEAKKNVGMLSMLSDFLDVWPTPLCIEDVKSMGRL